MAHDIVKKNKSRRVSGTRWQTRDSPPFPSKSLPKKTIPVQRNATIGQREWEKRAVPHISGTEKL